MQSKQVAPIFYWKNQHDYPDLIASVASYVSLPEPFSCRPIENAAEGDLVMVRVRDINRAYPTLETPEGEEVALRGGELIVGVLGNRKALRGFSGRLPARLHPHMPLNLLNKGGVIGECTAFHRDLGWPATVEYLGTVHRDGKPLNLKDNALPLVEGTLPDIPLVLVFGTCMNAGKTSVCKQIIRLFSEKGFTIHAGKVAGVACLQDLLAMKDNGAQKVMSFNDLGLASTTEVASLVPIARALVHHLAQPRPDFIVLEMGDGILGSYHVASLFNDRELMQSGASIVLCANDLLGAWGGIEWMSRHEVRPSLVSGPVTDSAEGIQYIEENWHVPAANAFDCAGKICTQILGSFMPWLKLA
ncbi:MAG: hypothetical protein HY645_05730 [Acidobacteria bacterium]|nr:hypothetical protein [Acidobacteriota bacterium]